MSDNTELLDHYKEKTDYWRERAVKAELRVKELEAVLQKLTDYGRVVLAAKVNLESEVDLLREHNEELVRVAAYVLKVIDDSEHWWMSSPGKGGFDTTLIDAALNRVAGEEANKPT